MTDIHNVSSNASCSELPEYLQHHLDQPVPERLWPISGLFAEGVTLLVGTPNVHKTTFVLQLALAVASGVPAFGYFPTMQGNVHYISPHNSKRRIHERFQHILHENSGPAALTISDICYPLCDGASFILEERIARFNGTLRMLIIDPYSPMMIIKKKRTLSPVEVIYQLRGIAEKYQLAIVLVDYQRPDKFGDLSHCISISFATSLDAFARFGIKSGERSGKLYIGGEDLASRSFFIDFDQESLLWKAMLLTYHSDSLLTPEREEILFVLNQAGCPLSPTDIAATLDKDLNSINQMLFSMLHAGLVFRPARGQYVPSRKRTYASGSTISNFNKMH